MVYENNGRVDDLLGGLMQKVERLSQDKEKDLMESQRALESMNQLVEAMKRLESQKKREKQMAQKVAYIQSRLERAAVADRGSFEAKNITDAFFKLLHGAKTTGQVIEIVAGSLQVMIETVRTVMKSQPATRGHSGETKNNDLVALLKPINVLLSSLMTKPPVTATPELVIDKEAVDEKTKEEPVSVPVVKAVPATENTFPEISENK